MPENPTPHADGFVDAFVHRFQRERARDLLRRSGFGGLIADGIYRSIDERWIETIVPGQQTAPKIAAALHALGAPASCVVLDGRSGPTEVEVPLAGALESIVGWDDDVVVSCLAGELAYLETEGVSARYILHRPASRR
ncbi:hypothetical protein [Nocardia sp. NPDC056100]|uniref:hypothetical protein n=1 Tax=Nocardia sp. NPDC056100 TaxID=3345712 RepID=UPI0035E106DD